MTVYSLPATVNNTEIRNAFVFTDSDITDGSFPGYQDTGYGFDNADDILRWFDGTINTSLWRKAPQACYNGGASQYALEYLVALIENYWGTMTNFKRLPTIYHQSATISNTAIIDGDVISVPSSVSIGGNNETTDMLAASNSSPFQFTIGASYTASTLYFYFPVLPDEAVQEGKLHLDTDMTYAGLTFRIYLGGSSWQLDAYVSLTASVPQDWVDKYNGKDVGTPDEDPYSQDDESDTGGGGDSGDQDAWDDGDTTPVPPLPDLSAVDTGFITIYNPNITELQSLASYMWTGLFDIDNFRKIMANPMDTILGLSMVPVNVPAGSQQTVMVGNISTGVSMTKASAQYVKVDCGHIKLKELRHSYLDYSPYTKISIMLPYIGSYELDIDQLYSSDSDALGCVYHVDILSGACVAFITFGDDVIAQYSGQCAVSIPISANDFTNTIRALAGLVNTGIKIATSAASSSEHTPAQIGGYVTDGISSALNVMTAKPNYIKSGNIGGGNGILSVQKPYIILERPRLCAPKKQNEYTGYPGFITFTLGQLSGFTQVDQIHLDGIPMTDSEEKELLQILKEGVIL